MEIIQPNGEEKPKEDVKSDVPQEEPVVFRGNVDAKGVMSIQIDLTRVSSNQGFIDQFTGFLDRHKAIGLSIISQMINERRQLASAVMKQQNKNGMQSFLSKIRGKH